MSSSMKWLGKFRHFLPNCRMVRGLLHHYKSYGDVEGVNRTVQLKLGHWLRENNQSDGQLVVMQYCGNIEEQYSKTCNN